MIQLLSGDRLLILDPNGTYLQHEVLSWGCNLVDRSDPQYVDLNSLAPAILQPFVLATQACAHLPVLTRHASFPGTLFRLPLRTPATAKASQISQSSTSTEQACCLLSDFAAAAPDLMLFLRHVKKISIYTIDADRRSAVLKHASELTSPSAASAPKSSMHTVQVISQHEDGHSTSTTWLRAASSAAEGSAVAALLQDSSSDAALPLIDGRIFNTMMLPATDTGLPIHINGAFMVSSDRRSLWQGEGAGSKVCLEHP